MSQESRLNNSETATITQTLETLTDNPVNEMDLVGGIIDNLLQGVNYRVFILNRHGTVIWSNTAPQAAHTPYHAERWSLHNVNVGERFTRSFRVAAAMGDGTAAELLSGLNGVLHGRRESFDMDSPCIQGDALCWFHLRIAPFITGEFFIVSYRDISDSKRMEYELRRCRQLLNRGNRLLTERARHQLSTAAPDTGQRQAAAVFHYSSEAVVIADNELTILNVNEGFLRTTGLSVETVTGRSIHCLWPEQERERSETLIRDAARNYGHWQGELQLRCGDNERLHAWATVDMVFDPKGRPESYVFVFTDITQIKASQARNHYLAHHDPLTGLANRLLFWARTEQSIAHAARHGNRIALIFVDIDAFKAVNDSLGHPAGDRYLKEIAQRLRQDVRGEDTVARLGGDEFGVIAEEVTSLSDVTTFIDKLKQRLSLPIDIEGRTLYPSASVGFGIYPEDGVTPETLYQAADRAMYRSKSSRETQTDPEKHATQAYDLPIGNIRRAPDCAILSIARCGAVCDLSNRPNQN